MQDLVRRIEVLGRITEKVHNILEDDIFLEIEMTDVDFCNNFSHDESILRLKQKIECIKIKLYECLAVSMERS